MYSVNPRTILTAVVFIALLIAITFAYSGASIFTPMFTIQSSAFTNNGPIPDIYTCKGVGKTPPINFTNIPKNTSSIALYIFDPDAPKTGFVHWVLYDIDPKTPVIEEGKIPAGSVEGLNSANKVGYQPFCPPTGVHHYQFTAYALSNTYHFVKVPDITHLKNVMKGEVLARAQIIGTYGQK
jgi:Raf kinase inhibitor-like YbhB/YbcL family protein